MEPPTADAPEHLVFSVRPSFLFVGVKYALAAAAWIVSALVLASVAASANIPFGAGAVMVAVVGVLVFIGPVLAHVRRQRLRYTLTNYKLELEEGLLSVTTRNVPLAKIQDVTTTGTFLKRLLGIGDVLVDTAAEGGRVLLRDVPDAKTLADSILRELRRRN